MATLGRPSLYTEELADRICEAFGTHAMSLPRICKLYDWMPSYDTISAWRYKYKQFSDKMLIARAEQSHILFESSLADVEEIKEHRYIDGLTGATKVDPGIVAAQKALASHKTKMAGVIKPRIYGDKQQVETTVKHEDKITDLE